jgi:UDP-2,4-diacetamido-2,4,6-trideoxy-beta-L-altropyranose hydrolase
MTILFRCDASVTMGSGHVMRCLTLANAIVQDGGHCTFVCRVRPGHLIDRIVAAGHAVISLPAPSDQVAGWLGVPLEREIADIRAAIAALQVSRIVVDHYGLDAVWETAVAPPDCPVMVIDDMADRPHVCDILLDQNLGRHARDYDGLLLDGCIRLIGPDYALLRPEFAAARAASLARRQSGGLHHILISMGGMDADNATTRVLDALADHPHLPEGLHISTVMGGGAPHLETVRARASTMPVPTDVRVDVTDMATLMTQADLAIGAAGGTSWERCCLGLPTLMLIVADNQASSAAALQAAGGAVVLQDPATPNGMAVLHRQIRHCSDPTRLRTMAYQAAAILDGKGTQKVLRAIIKETVQ